MKYCNDSEKALIACIAILGIVMIIRIGRFCNHAIDDIVYEAKTRFVLKQCDECIEKADKARANHAHDKSE